MEGKILRDLAYCEVLNYHETKDAEDIILHEGDKIDILAVHDDEKTYLTMLDLEDGLYYGDVPQDAVEVE